MVLEQNGVDVRARLVALRKGNYTVYVFENLDASNEINRYLMCTRCPNWSGDDLEISQEGFLKYKFVNCGKDTWYNAETCEHCFYKYSANYFIDFVPLTHVIDGNRIIEHQKLIVT